MPCNKSRTPSPLLSTLVCLTAMVVACRIIPDGPGVPWQLAPPPQLLSLLKLAYYASLSLLGAYCLTVAFRRSGVSLKPVSALCVMLTGIAALSLMVNPVSNQVFQSWPRLLTFILVTVVCGPVLFSPIFHEARWKLLRFLCVGCIAISLLYCIALVFYLTHYTSYLSRYQFVWDWLNVASVPCGAASAIGVLYAWTQLSTRPSGSMKLSWGAALALCWWSMVMASSRAAIAAVALALTSMLMASVRRGNTPPCWLKWVSVAMIAFMVVAVFRPLTEIMETKYWKITDTPEANFFTSRQEIWETRSEEADGHLLFGIGFASVESNPGLLNPTAAVPADGRIEPGSSWLYLLSSCGIFALIAFAFIYLWSVWGAVRMTCRSSLTAFPSSLLILGMTLLFGVHLCTEGYVMAAGSPFCIILWLTLGLACTSSLKTHKG